MPATPDQFAESIKKKYPQYANVPNATLARSFVEKYPVYASQVDFGTQPGPAGAPASATKTTPYPQMGQSGLPALPGQEPDYTPMDEKRAVPANARFPKLGPGFYDLADFTIKAFPVVGQYGGALGGAALGSPGGPLGTIAGGTVGGGLGAAGGELLERPAYKALYKDLPPESTGDALESAAITGLFGTVTELPNQAFNVATKPFLQDVKLARQAQAEAKAGTGVRLTPGEAGNDPTVKLVESVMEHWPGGAGEMEEFRAKQVTDVRRMMNDVLKKINDEDLPPEQAGKLIRQAVLDAKRTLDPQLGAQLDQVESQLLNIVNYRVGKTLSGLGPDEIPAENVGKGIQQKVREDQAQAEATTKQRIEDLRARQEQSKDELFQGQFQALSPAEVPREDVGKQVQQHFQTEKQRSDDILERNVDTVRTEQKANVQTVLERQLKMLSPQELTSEQSGLLVQSEVNNAERQSDAAVTVKFDKAKHLLGVKGQFLNRDELTEAAAENPEAKAALDEARLLAKQEFERFDHDILKKVQTTQKPEDISTLLANAGIEDLRILNGILPPQVQKAAARELLDSMIYRARDPRSGVVSAQSLANSLKQLGEERGRLIFGTQYDTILRDASSTIDGINTAADARVERLTGQANAPYQPKLIQDILKTTKPEEVAKLIETAGLNDLRAVNAAIPPPLQKAASRAVLEDIIERARDPQSGIINGTKVATSLFKLGEERGRLIFGDRYDSIVHSSQEFERINARTEEVARQIQTENTTYSRDLFKTILKTGKPEEIVKKVQTAGLEELRQLVSSLPAEQEQALRRSVYQDMVDRARDPQTGLVNARKLATYINNLQQRGSIIFGDQYQNIVQTSRVLDRLTEAAEKKTSTLSARSSRFDQKLYNDIISTNNPELIGGYFRNPSVGPDELRDFMHTVDPETAAIAQRNVVEDMLAPARDIKTRELDPKKLTKGLSDGLRELGPNKGQILFGKQGWENLTDASKLLDRIAFSGNSPQAKMHMAGIVSAGIGLFTGGVAGGIHSGDLKGIAEGAAIGGLTFGASAYLLPKVLAFTLTSPRFAVPMMQILRAAAALTFRGIPLAANELIQSSPAQDAVLPHMIIPPPRTPAP